MPASAVTLAALLAGLLAIVAASLGRTEVALGLWLLNRLLDGLDGEVARAWGRQSDLGGYLDLLSDFVVYALLPVGLATSHGAVGTWVALAAMLAAFYLNAGSWMLLSALIEKRRREVPVRSETTSVAMPSGLVEGGETFILFTLFLLLPAHLPFLFGLTAGLVGITAAQRTVGAIRVLHRMHGMGANA